MTAPDDVLDGQMMINNYDISSDYESGGSYLVSEAGYDRYIDGQENIGRDDGQFMIPKNQMDDMMQEYPDNPREWENQLGINEGSLGNDKIYRVDINSPEEYNLRQSQPWMSGANEEKFLYGGKVPGGQDEAVTDSFPNPETHSEIGKVSVINVKEQTLNTGSVETGKADDIDNDNVSKNNLPASQGMPNTAFNTDSSEKSSDTQGQDLSLLSEETDDVRNGMGM